MINGENVINYNIDDNGVLRVYRGENTILFEISECANCSDKDIQTIIKEELDRMTHENKEVNE